MAAPTFMELLARKQLGAFFFVRISGLPYLWSNRTVPSDWDEGGAVVSFKGEDYLWVPTLSLDDIGTVSIKAEPKAGVGRSGTQTLRFKVRGDIQADLDRWLHLMVRDLLRPDELATQLAGDLLAGDAGVGSTADVLSASPWSPELGHDAYMNIETVGVGDISSGTLEDLTRGLYGSWPMTHRYLVDIETESRSGGMPVTTWAAVLDRRLISLYLVLGRLTEGRVEPYQPSLSVSPKHHQMIWRGVIIDQEEGDDTLTLGLKTASLDQLLAAKVAERLPAARAWVPADMIGAKTLGTFGTTLIYVGPHNWWLNWRFQLFDTAVSTSIGVTKLGVRLIRDDGASGSEDVPEGLHTVVDVVQYIAHTIDNTSGGLPYSTTQSTRITPTIRAGDADDQRLLLSIRVYGSNYQYLSFELIPQADYTAIVRELGYTKPIQVDPDPITGGAWYRMTADKGPPLFRWPGPDERGAAPGRLYYDRAYGPAFDEAPGWKTDAGVAINGFVRLGKHEILEFDGVNSETIGNNTYNYLEIVRRFALNSRPDKELEVKFGEAESKIPTIIQGIAMHGIKLPRILLYLGIGGSGDPGTLHTDYDQGWLGSGLALPSELFDVTGLEALAAERGALRSQVWIDEPAALRDLLADELLIDQVLLIASADWEAGEDVQFRLVSMDPPSEARQDDARVLDHSNTRTFGPQKIGLDRSEDRIINVVNVKAGYNPASKKFEVDIPARQHTSIATYGVRETLDLKVKWLSGSVYPSLLAQALADVIFARWAFPYAIVELSTAAPTTWSWMVGDEVLVTNDHLPDPEQPGRGVVAMPTRIYVKDDWMLGKDKASGRLTMIGHGLRGERFSDWAPCCLLDTQQNSTTWTVFTHTYSESSDPVDASYFAVGDQVILWVLGVDSIEYAEITTINDTTVRFESPPSGVVDGKTVMLFAEYDDANLAERQRRWTAMSDGDGKLDRDSGDDAPFFYL